MPYSPHSSSESAICRLEWRPSRIVAVWLVALMVLAPVSILASSVPRLPRLPLAVLAFAIAYRSWRQYGRLQPVQLRIGVDGSLLVDGVPRADWRLHWRAGLVFICWLDAQGHRQARLFGPDILPASQRRELRLATPAPSAIAAARAMAT